MLDIRLLRNDPDGVRAGLSRKGVEQADVDRAIALDLRRRDCTRRRDELRAAINTVSREVGAAKRDGDEARAAALAEESRRLGVEEEDVEAQAAEAEAELRNLLLRIPNLPADGAPDGSSADDNVVVRVEGYDPELYADHQRVPHW